MKVKERKHREKAGGEREKAIQREKESKLGKQENHSEEGEGLFCEITETGIL